MPMWTLKSVQKIWRHLRNSRRSKTTGQAADSRFMEEDCNEKTIYYLSYDDFRGWKN